MIAQRSSRAAVADVYEDCAPLIRQVAHTFARQCGWELDEAVAQATLYFLEAYHTLDPDRGRLEPRIQYYVRARLLDDLQKAGRKQLFNLPDGAEPARRSPDWFDLGEFRELLSDDARFVLDLLFDSPPEMDAALRADRTPGYGAVARALRSYLRGRGWPAPRVAEAFAEIAAEL